VTANWLAQMPDFVVLKEDLCAELQRGAYDLAIADGAAQTAAITKRLDEAGKPAIVIHSDSDLSRCAAQGSVVLFHRQADDWPSIVGVLGSEILRRVQAEGRARQAEHARAIAEAEAMLGRYMVEMRHTVSNSLTSVLGNAELLSLEPGLPASVLAQADTIRNMALRLHEVFQRFSSIEKELHVVAREAGKQMEGSALQVRAATAR